MICSHVRRYCAETPDRTAFVIGGATFDYRTFGAHVSGIAARLEEKWANETVVGVLAHDDVETYAAIFAIWFLGKTFVPLGPTTPPDRNRRILEQAGLRVVLSARADGLAGLENEPGITFEATKGVRKDGPLPDPRAVKDADDAYILFTSGSTGQPKGVPISFGALEAFLRAFDAMGFDVSSDDRVLQMFDLTFDLSLMSYCVPLTKGASCYTVAPDAIKYLAIYDLMEKHELTIALMVPSILAHLRPFFPEIRLEKARAALFCGEALFADLADAWAACVPNARVENVYGPTEATIFCTTYTCVRGAKHKGANGVVSIGKPMLDMGVLIVDPSSVPHAPRPMPVGEKGELCLTGPQLTLGYWKNPEKNREAFFEFEGKRYYRTGDLCSIDADGDGIFAGRVDHQVKVQGFRVELGEIDHHVREITGLAQAAAVAVPDAIGNTTIHLYLEAPAGERPDPIPQLKTRLASYMIPTKTTYLDKMPLNANGKIDRPALVRLSAAKAEAATHEKSPA